MAQIKKWKIGVKPANGKNHIDVFVDAETSTRALQIVKMQHPNAFNYTSPTEVK